MTRDFGKVLDIKLSRGHSVRDVMRMMRFSGGFMAAYMAEAFEIMVEMLRDHDCTRILSFTGNLMATGLRGVLTDMARRKMFDIVVTTCGALDHDLARSFRDYERGSFDADDVELREHDYHRLGSIFIRSSNYGEIIEQKFSEFVERLSLDSVLSTYELSWLLGEFIDSEDSFLYWCSRNRIPVIVPGIVDGAVGYQLWLHSQRRRIRIDLMRDEGLLSERMWEAKRTGALIVGGGISKHHVIWWSQFAGDGLDYAIYVTTADEYDGSLSGARPREAVSWRKIAPRARHTFVKADATIVLPFLHLATIQEIESD
ncbi:MAG: deoxyhypusine synthase [Aigarchaeota archaeon]|nr:deoxyhypusine synthase [Candidatus Pelearchaeum maunauluense]